MSFETVIEEYKRKMPKCRIESERASKLLPMGSPGGLGMFVMPHEIIVERGEGCYMWDIDGNKYLDFFCGDWTAALGYCNQGIID
ncbi:MAG: aminotransferase class III-fold pyridoxal phosphate-dependent enzyme, partial [Pseudomonadales bacterium]